MLRIFHALPWLKPFDVLDIDAERNRMEQLFTEENAEKVMSTYETLNYREEQSLLTILAFVGIAMPPIITIRTIWTKMANPGGKSPSSNWQ